MANWGHMNKIHDQFLICSYCSSALVVTNSWWNHPSLQVLNHMCHLQFGTYVPATLLKASFVKMFLKLAFNNKY